MKRTHRMKKTHRSFDPHAFKLLLQRITEKYPFDSKCELKFYEQLEEKINEANPRQFRTGPEISYKTLNRYFETFHSEKFKRYTPNEISLDILSRFVRYKNWKEFQKDNMGKKVDIIFPYEKKISYLGLGLWEIPDSSIKKIIYYGNPMKYVGFEISRYGTKLIDYKNITQEMKTQSFQMISSVKIGLSSQEPFILDKKKTPYDNLYIKFIYS